MTTGWREQLTRADKRQLQGASELLFGVTAEPADLQDRAKQLIQAFPDGVAVLMAHFRIWHELDSGLLELTSDLVEPTEDQLSGFAMAIWQSESELTSIALQPPAVRETRLNGLAKRFHMDGMTLIALEKWRTGAGRKLMLGLLERNK